MPERPEADRQVEGPGEGQGPGVGPYPPGAGVRTARLREHAGAEVDARDRSLAQGSEDPQARAGAAVHVQSPAERAERGKRAGGRVKHAIGGAERRVVELRGQQVIAALDRASRAAAASPAQQASLVREFKKAWEAGDIGALIGLLDPEATVTADGGGLVTAAVRPIEGGGQIARFYAGIVGIALNVTIMERTVNGQAGLVAQLDGVVTVFAFDIARDRIKHIWAVRNPEKLRPWTTG